MSKVILRNLPSSINTVDFDYNNSNEEEILNLLEDLNDLLYTKKISNEKNRKYISEGEFDKVLENV